MALSFHLDDNVNRTMRNRNVDRYTQLSPWRSRHRSVFPESRKCSDYKTVNDYNFFDKKGAQVQRPHGTMKDPWSRIERSFVQSTRESNKTLEKWRNKRATLPAFSQRDDRATATSTFKPTSGGSVGKLGDIVSENITAYDNHNHVEDYGEHMYNNFIWNNPLNKDYNYSSEAPNEGFCGGKGSKHTKSYVSRSRLANPQGNVNYGSAAHFYDIRTRDKFMARASLHHRHHERDRDEEFQAMEFTETPRKRYAGMPPLNEEV